MDYGNLPTSAVEKFWANVEKTDYCWNWTGTVKTHGLPIIYCNIDEKQYEYIARRVSVVLTGKTLNTSDYVQPLICHNKLCVNPDHLVYGNEARFYAKVSKLLEVDGGCWPWLGHLNKEGYGKLNIRKDGRLIQLAHIYSWELANNHKVRTDIGMVVMHKCDHPWCVNPDHLSLGTHNENARDREEKGRGSRGNRKGLPQTKMTQEKVQAMIQEYSLGKVSYNSLAVKYGISKSAVAHIIKRKRWGHIIA